MGWFCGLNGNLLGPLNVICADQIYCIQYVDHRSMMWLGFIHCAYINQSSAGFIHNSSLSSFYFTL